MRLDEILSIIITVLAAVIALYLARTYGAKHHKMLTRLVAANIVLDAKAILIWAAFPATQWSIYRLGFSIVGTEAALAAAFFGMTLFGLIKRKTWAPVLAVALTITQRAFAPYVFFPSSAIALTIIWSLTIVFIGYKELKNSN